MGRLEDDLMDLAIGGDDGEVVEEIEITRQKAPDPDPELVEKRTTTTTTEVRRRPHADDPAPSEEL